MSVYSLLRRRGQGQQSRSTSTLVWPALVLLVFWNILREVPRFASLQQPAVGISTVNTDKHQPQSGAKYENVVVMGQFNYADNPLNEVIFWVRKWSQWFTHVEVRGPWNHAQLQELRTIWGIRAYQSTPDAGFVSPMENLMRTLEHYKNATSIEGVLYIHDDALLDLEVFTKGLHPFPTNEIIGSTYPTSFSGMAFSDPNYVENKTVLSQSSYTIHPHGVFSKPDGTIFQANETTALIQSLEPWVFWNRCHAATVRAYGDARMDEFKNVNHDGTLVIPTPAQSDMLFVPTVIASEFIRALSIMVDHRVFLECGIPTAVQMVRSTYAHQVAVRTVPLCTSWDGLRGTQAGIFRCIRNENTDYGMYHPFKLSKGLMSWDTLFDLTVSHAGIGSKNLDGKKF